MQVPNYIEARESPAYVRLTDLRFFTFNLEGAANQVWKMEDISSSTVTDVSTTLFAGGLTGGTLTATTIVSPLCGPWSAAGKTYRLSCTYNKGGETPHPYIRIFVLP